MTDERCKLDAAAATPVEQADRPDLHPDQLSLYLGEDLQRQLLAGIAQKRQQVLEAGAEVERQLDMERLARRAPALIREQRTRLMSGYKREFDKQADYVPVSERPPK